MSILKVGRNRKDGTRAYSLWVSVRNRGERIRLRSPEQTLEGARRYERLLRRTLAEHGTLDVLRPAPKPLDPTFAEFAERWQRDEVDTIRKLSGRITKRKILRLHIRPRFDRTPLSEINASAVDGFVADLSRRGLGAKTINNTLTVLRTCLRDAVRWQLLKELPAIRLRSAKSPPPRFLSHEDVMRLVAAAPTGMWRTMVLMAVSTGLRANELLALEWRDLDLQKRLAIIARGEVLGIVDTPKDDETRTVPLSHELVDALAGLERTSDRVFPMPPVQARYQYSLRRLQAASRGAGIHPPVTWHVLRHTFATLSLMAGVPITAVRDIMGHSNIETTDIYSHYATNLLSHAADQFPRLTEVQPVDSISAEREDKPSSDAKTLEK